MVGAAVAQAVVRQTMGLHLQNLGHGNWCTNYTKVSTKSRAVEPEIIPGNHRVRNARGGCSSGQNANVFSVLGLRQQHQTGPALTAYRVSCNKTKAWTA